MAATPTTNGVHGHPKITLYTNHACPWVRARPVTEQVTNAGIGPSRAHRAEGAPAAL